MSERNALAELAKELADFQQYLHEEFKVGDRGLEKAQCIIAELAKVTYLICDGVAIGTNLMEADNAIVRCRRIAEEGADNGK